MENSGLVLLYQAKKSTCGRVMCDQVDCVARADTPEASKFLGHGPIWQLSLLDTKPQTDHQNNVLFPELVVSLRIAFVPTFNIDRRFSLAKRMAVQFQKLHHYYLTDTLDSTAGGFAAQVSH